MVIVRILPKLIIALNHDDMPDADKVGGTIINARITNNDGKKLYGEMVI